MKKRQIIAMMLAGLMIIGGCSGSSDKELSAEEAKISLSNKLEKLSSEVGELPLVKDLGDGKEDTTALYDQLPDAQSEYPPSVVSDADIVLEIASSPEKAGSGTNGSLLKIAENFNKEKLTVGSKTVGISVTSISSGEAIDYYVSGKYVWDLYSPSSTYWGEVLSDQGVDVEMITDRIAGNTAGFVFKQDVYDAFIESYGEVNAGTVAQAVIDGQLSFGYTNPNASSTGLNFLISMLYSFDAKNPLSTAASDAFIEFSRNIDHLSFTTIQLTTKVSNGSINAFVYEYQNYMNTPALSDYVFVPFGVRHDSPVYTVGTLDQEEKEAAELFTSYCLESQSQKIFTDNGFNQLEDYQSEELNVSGNTIIAAQNLWQEKKTTSEMAVVFVLDVSGSMAGDPINNIKSTLNELITQIDTSHYIGMVTYSTDVNIDLPIAQFDSTQQAYFRGAVNRMAASGNTATNDALVVAMDMLTAFSEDHGDAKPMVILMSDGEQTSGYDLKDVSNIFKGLGVPINTVSYNTDAPDLETLANLNEGAQINATTDNVLYKLIAFLSASL